MHHVRTIDRYKSLKKKKNNKNKKMEHETIKTAAAVANPSSSPQKENGGVINATRVSARRWF